MSAPSSFGITEKARLMHNERFLNDLNKLYDFLGYSQRTINLHAAAIKLGCRIRVDQRYAAPGQIGSSEDGARVIGLREDPQGGRCRFTFAHEIAHEVVRQQKLWPISEDGKARHPGRNEESFCNFVAGLLLMPPRTLEPRLRAIATDYPRTSSWSLLSLAAEFRVSMSALLVQLTLIEGLRFLLEVFEYGSTAPTVEDLVQRPPTCSMFSASWKNIKNVADVSRIGTQQNIVTQRICKNIGFKSGLIMNRNSTARRTSVRLRPEFIDDQLNDQSDRAVVVLERTADYREVRHMLTFLN